MLATLCRNWRIIQSSSSVDHADELCPRCNMTSHEVNCAHCHLADISWTTYTMLPMMSWRSERMAHSAIIQMISALQRRWTNCTGSAPWRPFLVLPTTAISSVYWGPYHRDWGGQPCRGSRWCRWEILQPGCSASYNRQALHHRLTGSLA